MGKKSEGLSAVLKRLGPAKAKEMDEAAKRGMFGQPEKAAKKEKNATLTKKEMEDLQKSLNEKKKSKGSGLTKAEEDAMDRVAQRRVREGGSERGEGMSKEDKPRRLTKREQEREQEMLKFKKGGMVKSYANGGMTTKKMMGGGMATKYSKGGMANCGASMKPSGISRNK
jgi:hypothetical protein